MSYVKEIFTTKKYVVLVYSLPAKNNQESIFLGQFYTLEGKLQEEIPFPGKASGTMYFDKDNDIIYSVVFEPDDDLDELHYLTKYRIRENQIPK